MKFLLLFEKYFFGILSISIKECANEVTCCYTFLYKSSQSIYQQTILYLKQNYKYNMCDMH